MSDLREALAFYGDPDSYTGHEQTVLAAARRFLALTETGPDYEAAEALFDEGGDLYWLNSDRLAVDALVRKIVGAALADYLTEEAENE